MDVFRASAAAACFLGIIFCIIEKLAPSEKYAKQLGLVFAMILALTVVKPFMNFSGEDFSDLSVIEDIPSIASDNTRFEEKAAQNVSDVLMELLEENGIKALKISVEINNLSDGSIVITEVLAEISGSGNTAAAKELLENAVGGAAVTVTAAEDPADASERME